MEKVRFGVIGIGNMGTSHSGWLVGNRIEGAELTAVCDIDEKRREWAKENLPGTVTVYDDYMHEAIINCITACFSYVFMAFLH